MKYLFIPIKKDCKNQFASDKEPHVTLDHKGAILITLERVLH